MKTVVLAFHIERTGAKPEHETIAIELSVVDDKFQCHDSLLLKGFIPRPIPSQENGPVAPAGFEHRSWVEYWSNKIELLQQLTTDCITFHSAQLAMITGFQEFRKKWELRAENDGFNLEICCDNPAFDCSHINSMISKYLPEYHPLPYRASTATYQPILDTDSMLRGVLAAADTMYSGASGMSARIRKLYEITIPCASMHSVSTHSVSTHSSTHIATCNTAYNIACDAQIVLGIRRGEILRAACCCCAEDEGPYTHWNCSEEILSNMVTRIEKSLAEHGSASWGGGIVCKCMRHLLKEKYELDMTHGSYITITGRKKV